MKAPLFRAQVEKNKKCNWKKTDTYISVTRNIEKEKKAHVELIKKNNVDTVYKVWQNSVKTYGHKKCLGTRQVFGEEDEQQKSGKVFKKLILGNYEWINYNQADKILRPFGSGLASLGLKAKDPVCIYAETRQEWLLSAIAAFSQNLIVTTLYTNLGEEAICHGILETEVSDDD